MGKPAAPIGDLSSCPRHGDGWIFSGAPKVIIGQQPAARKGDTISGGDGSTDIIAKGSSIVKICGQPAARVGDKTDHGGKIEAGFPEAARNKSAIF